MSQHPLQPSRPVSSQPSERPPKTQVERAYLLLRKDIVQGKLPPGYKLRVEHLKENYGVGAGTLREALSLLIADALVYAEGQRGFRVTPISLSDLEDLTNQRVLLETQALRESIRHGGDRWEAELRAAYEAMEKVRHSGSDTSMQEFEYCNKRFHEALIAGYASPWTRYLLSILSRHSERYRYMTLKMVATHTIERDVHGEHEIIYRAALARQDARAALALETHVRTTCELIRQVARQQALPGFDQTGTAPATA